MIITAYKCPLRILQDYVKFWPDGGRHEYDMVSIECLPDIDESEDVTWTNVMKPVYRTMPSELIIRRFQVVDKRVSESL